MQLKFVRISFQKEEKDASAIAVATVVDAAFYQPTTPNPIKPQEQIRWNSIPKQTEEVVEVDDKPVLSKFKISNLNLW